MPENKPNADGWKGVPVNLPMYARTGIATPEQQDEIARQAQAARDRAAANMPSQEFGRRNGITVELAQFLQRMEGRILELENEVKELRNLTRQPAHLAHVEKRRA